MAKRALLSLTMGIVLASLSASVFAQAVAESAVTHAGSALSANLASKLGGRIQQSISNSQDKVPQDSRRVAQTRTRRGKARTPSVSGAPISISSVQGGAAPCAPVNPKTASAQDHAAAGSSRTDCLSKNPTSPAASENRNPSEITVSFK